MSISLENILLLGSLLLFISIVASKTSFRLGIPTLLLFLAIGMLAGSDGVGGIHFDDPKSTQFLGIIAMTLILFSGGMDTKTESIRPVLKNGIALATIGVLVTALSVGWFASWLLKIPLLTGMLLGAIVSSTDAAAVFSILRTRNIGLKGNLRPLLEFESGSNDPMAYFLTIVFIELVQEPNTSMILLIPKFLKGMLLGAACGFGSGRLMTLTLNRIRLDVEGLYPVLVLSMIFFTFSFTDSMGGNGFLAVYLSGIILGNGNVVHKKSLIKFFDGWAWLMQIIMFLTLGLLVFPSQIVPIMWEGLLLSIFLILVARPLAVFICLSFSKDLNNRKKIFVSWVGLRGAAPIVFATFPLVAGIDYAHSIFNLVFFISGISVLLQGSTLSLMAKWLHVSVPSQLKRQFPIDLELKDNSKRALLELDIVRESQAIGKRVVQLGLPKKCIIVLIHRGNEYISPNGETLIEQNDHLLILVDTKENMGEVASRFDPYK
ncbi:MAG: potassium/proton antiporter [Bacteroidetes bacterium]|nr:potassium/proton antiporter [Bacteroidota bacterium]